MAATASDVVGHTVELSVVDPEQWAAAQIAAGQPEFVTRFTLGMFQAAAAGYFAGTDPLLTELLVRAPQTVRDELTTPSPH